MANKKITDLTELTSVADGDLVCIVDVSDTTGSSAGTTKKIQKSNLVAGAGGGNEYFTQVSGAYISGTGAFYNLPIGGFSQTEATSVQWYHKFAVPANVRLVDVTVMYQRGATGRTINLTAYDHNIPSQGANLGQATNGPLNATATGGGNLVFNFNTSAFDYTSSSEIGLGINIGGTVTSSTTLLGVAITMRFKFT